MSWTTSYMIKIRRREQHDVAVHGGQKVGAHRRRVTRWSKWQTASGARGPLGALEGIELVKRAHPGAEVGVFYQGKRVTEAQLRTRAKELMGEDAT